MDSPSQSSFVPSLKQSYCEPSTSRKRVASSSPDLFDSSSEEIDEWRRSSIAWKKSHDQKVAQCLARNRLPIGPVEKYLSLTSPILIPDQTRSDSAQQISPPVVPAPHATRSGVEPTREHPQMDSVDLNGPSSPTSPQSHNKTRSGRILLAPETPGLSLALKTKSVLLAPETPASSSSIFQFKKAPTHTRSPGIRSTPGISDEPKQSTPHEQNKQSTSCEQTKQSTSREKTKQSTSHDVVNLVDRSSSVRERWSNFGRVSSRSEAFDSSGLHRTTSETSSASIKMKTTKRSRRESQVKEIDTLDAYDKLTAKERSARFPRVEMWADFLAHSNRISSKRSKAKVFMNRCRIYYLIDPSVQHNLDDADRMRMRRLFEAGAQIQPELRSKQVTHIIVRNDTSWNSCLRAIRSVVSDPSERQTIKEMCLASLEKTPGDELIWIMDFKWVTSCLSYGAVPVEKYTCIRPRASKVLQPPKPLPMTSAGSQDYNRSTESEEHNIDSDDEIETSISLR
ncbi:hypothetical protein PtA15_8A393 [Puccinia triticina]|nr:uncharacterized protein PtA15_8A393 [Puccinia triticina]WAQ87489.1 hypothetical protein PtA15_8A393 [Puccinia triticina]